MSELARALRLDYAPRMSGTIIGANIAELRAHLGDKQAAFADRIGARQSYISKWESGDVEPSYSWLKKLAHLAGWTVDEFAERRWAPGAKGSTRRPKADDDTVDVLSLDLSFSMGPGTTIDDYIEETAYKFDHHYLQQFTRTPSDRLRLARGVGESMFPTLVSSDLVWIDTTQRVLNQQDRIWAISLFGAAAIKRLRAIGNDKVLVISDNPTVENQEVSSEDIVIGGRVIRLGRDL